MSTDTPDRILRLKAGLQRTGLCRSTLYCKVETGRLPRQIRISERCVGWRESQINEWMRHPIYYKVGT